MKCKQRLSAPFWGAALAAILVSDYAVAYVGPGAGLGAIGTVVALLGGLVLAIVGFVWYPIKRLVRRRRAERDDGAKKREEVTQPNSEDKKAKLK